MGAGGLSPPSPLTLTTEYWYLDPKYWYLDPRYWYLNHKYGSGT